jgi:hypothetical protein
MKETKMNVLHHYLPVVKNVNGTTIMVMEIIVQLNKVKILIWAPLLLLLFLLLLQLKKKLLQQLKK